MLNDLKSLSDILSMPPLDWTIETLLPRAGICILAGTPKAGKSVIILDNLLRGVQGRPAFGRFNQSFKKVLLVNIEGRHQGIKMRDMMYTQVPQDVRDRIIVSGEPLKFTNRDGSPNLIVMEQFAARLRAEGIDLVVLDPLVSFHMADENDSQAMVEVLDALRDVGEKTKVGFVVLHHTRKLSSIQTLQDAIDQGGDMMRGAGGIFGAVDSAILVWPVEKRRLFTFSVRYAKPGCDISHAEMQMDRMTFRMYPVVNDLPDPVDWAKDQPSMDWAKYGVAFGLGADAISRARGLM